MSKNETTAALRTIRRSAMYDLIVTAPFATPWTAKWLVRGMAALHDGLGLPGERPALDGAVAILMANLLGTLVVLWSIARLRETTLAQGVTDTIARAVFAAWMVWALIAGASAVIGGFLVAEVAWGVVQGRAVRAAGKLAG
jgi:uncharacterized membrane protein YqgA involved in biofilm formation